jgi:hypothetical protein
MGHGLIYYFGGDIYEGGYRYDLQHGRGRYIWNDHR